MSYILSALKKSQQERAGVVIPSATVAYLPHVPSRDEIPDHPPQAEIGPEPRGRPPVPGGPLLLSGALLAAMALGASVFFWRMTGTTVDSKVNSGGASAPAETRSVAERSIVSRPSTSKADILASPWPRGPLLARKLAEGRASGITKARLAVAGGEPPALPVPSAFHPPEGRIAQSPTSRRPQAVPVALAARGPSPLPKVRPVVVDEVPVAPPQLPAEEAAAAGESAAASSEVPRLDQLPIPLRRGLPPLKLSVHAYDPQPGRRFVRINSAKRREGDRLEKDLWLQEITKDGAVLRYRDLTFSIDAY